MVPAPLRQPPARLHGWPGRSGFGLKAQHQAVAAHVARAGGALAAEFQEVESGKRADRPQFAASLAACRIRRAVLLIVKLDRLAPNARFLLSGVKGSGEAWVVFCHLPTCQPARSASSLSPRWPPSRDWRLG